MNASEFANGSCIFTQNGYYAREFVRRTHGGMVGVNVGIPVPVSYFPFAGHKRLLLRRPPCDGPGRRRLLHRVQVRHLTVVFRRGQARKEDRHLGRDDQPLLSSFQPETVLFRIENSSCPSGGSRCKLSSGSARPREKPGPQRRHAGGRIVQRLLKDPSENKHMIGKVLRRSCRHRSGSALPDSMMFGTASSSIVIEADMPSL